MIRFTSLCEAVQQQLSETEHLSQKKSKGSLWALQDNIYNFVGSLRARQAAPIMGTASVITKDHSQALADSGQRRFDILRRSAASEREPRPHPSHESRVGSGHIAQGV